MKERKALRYVGRTLLVIFTTLLLLILLVVGVVFLALRGPSTTVQELLTRTLKETSAAYFIPDLFLPEERVNEIMSYQESTTATEEVDTSLVTIRATQGEGVSASDEPGAEEAEFDETGIRLVGVNGPNYRGVMMIVRDPKRVVIGTPDQYGSVGLTLEQMIEKYDAVGGTNAGGFEDPNGTGLGGIPEGIVIRDGQLVWGTPGSMTTVIGFDGDGILHVGYMSAQEALNRGVVTACSFGPALIVNGEAMTSSEITSSGVNPRTAIGQRADGAVLMLVVDGRQITSLGATLEDLISIMLDFGAVNAANLDGGSSSLMLYEGEAMNINSSLIGTRPLATAIIVKGKGA